MRTLVLVLAWLVGAAWADALPPGMSFIGLKDGQWHIHVVADTGLKVLETASEPRSASFDRRRGVVAYVGSDSGLYRIGLEGAGEHRLLMAGRDFTLTQPTWSPSGGTLYFVGLAGGKSIETHLYALNPGETPRRITRQPGSRFEPRALGEDELVYAQVVCSLGCGRIIQEIGRLNLATGSAEQLTRLNAVARQPCASTDGRWVYFSSDAAGHFHLWRVAGSGGPALQLTRGPVRDGDPAPDARGGVWFLRHEPAATRLMHLDADGNLAAVPLPEGVTDLRNLEIAP